MKYKKYLVPTGIVLCLLLAAAVWGVSHNHKKGEIAITSYSDVTGKQAMFYTIETDGALILIDGGHAENSDQVRKVIRKNGNHVDAWILTHPHPDHIGAFLSIYNDLQKIKIDQIYATDIDAAVYQKYAKEWDAYELFEAFCDAARTMEHLTYLHKGDTLDIGGVHIDVCNAYFDGVENYTKDICNNSSLAFKVSGNSESMFFCADMYGKKMCNLVMKEYGDLIANCTYLQMGHHGNNSCTRKFVDLVNPKGAFFDAPQWLIEGEDYDTAENIAYLESKNAEVYTFMDAPNRVYLRKEPAD